jgi:hypothetical protein
MAGSTIAQDAVEAAGPPALVRAVLVTPAGADRLHAKYAFLYTLALPGRGVHLDPDAVEHLLGSRRLRLHRLHDGETLITAANAAAPSWHCCCTGPHRGPGLVLRLAGNGDVIGDTQLDLEQAGGMLVIDEADNEEKAHGQQAA